MTIFRVGVFLITALSAAALLYAVQFSSEQLRLLQDAKNQYAQVKAKQASLQLVESNLPAFRSFQSQFSGMNSSINSNGLNASDWALEKVSVKNAVIARKEIPSYLDAINHQQGSFFKPSAFTLKAVGESEDLFNWKSNSRSTVKILIDGEYLIRRIQ